MSESSSKSSQPLTSKQEKDGTEKQRRGRLLKQPPKEPSEVSTPKRPWGRPKKLEKEEEEGISQESSEEEQ
ncbi:high mobility group protein HMG-I/HMG-Y [Cricetulus griseus]|uniref:High mobility group protein HMG-I/HMG-Y n=1 Tax=Cricetulus griseus TaxID=10029 RepID=G3IC63_CRIGR|nr:high mobility group protein HMG-I/HMG-Y [Cricetulus griseus]XP_027276843.1 high mobility group protein HMG-I/HMG-Y [Cricetulus griseus]EGW01700.1 High mobility group protein HMG-I/HMG-Y [Cricetulus griseus]